MALLQALTIAVMALILAPGYSFYFDITPKVVVLLAGTALVVVCVPLLLSRDAEGRPGGRPRTGGSAPHSGAVLRAFSWLLVLNLLSLCLSTVVSAKPALSLFGTNWRSYGSVVQGAILLFAWLVAVVCAGRPERVKTVLRGVVAAGAVSAVYGTAQYFGWDPLLPAAAYHVGEGDYIIVRPPGTLGYASYFATWLLLVMFLCRALAAMEDSIAWRRFATGVMPLAAFAMLLTGTRAAILGLAAGGVVWFAIKRVRVTRRIVAWAAIAVIAGVVFYYSPSGQQMRSRARWFAEDPWGGARGKLWRDSLRMAANRLVAGYGPEVFTGEFPQYESVELARAYPDFSHESPHNIFLDALVAQGIPGFLALLGLCVLPFIAGRRAELTAALAAALVSQQFTAFTVPTAVTFFTVLALVVALETPAAQVRRRLALTAVAAALAAGLLFLAVRLMLADHALASTKQALDQGNLRSAAADYEKYQRLRLPGGTADLWYSRALLGVASKTTNPVERLSAMVQAGAAAQRATETAEDPFNAWYNLGVVYGLQNDASGAERSLRAAIAARPTWFKPHWMLAQVLRIEGRQDEARREALLAGELDAGKDPEVARTVQELEGHPQPLQR